MVKDDAWSQFVRNNVRSIKPKERINFFRMMTILSKSGVTLMKSLKMIHRSSKGPIKPLIGDMIAVIEEGSNFSKISKFYVKFFDDTMVSMLEAGEKSGNLPGTFEQIYENLKRDFEFKKKISGALKMPIFTMIFGMGVVFFMAFKVIPQFSTFLSAMGGKLPALTQFVVNFSDYMVEHWMTVITNAGIVIFSYIAIYASSRKIRYWIQYGMLYVPLIGGITLYGTLSNMTNSLEKLIGSGVGIVDSFKIAQDGVKLLPMKDILGEAQDIIKQGGNISEAFEKSSIIPLIFIDLLKAGEESGALDQSLKQISEIYREEADHKIAALQAAIMPIATLLIGGIVGVVAGSLIAGMVAMWSSMM